MQRGGYLGPESESHNLTGIYADMSPVTTQIWEGGRVEVAKRLLEWFDKGEAAKTTGKEIWNRPLIHAYVYAHTTSETRFYDLTDANHRQTLRQMATMKY